MGLRDLRLVPHLDIGLPPYFRARIDSSLSDSYGLRYLRFRARVGYLSGLDPAFTYTEWRGIVELTPLIPLTRIVFVLFTTGTEFGSILGDFSLRFQSRLWFERIFQPFDNDSVSITPYINAEAFFFDSRLGYKLSRMLYQTRTSIGFDTSSLQSIIFRFKLMKSLVTKW